MNSIINPVNGEKYSLFSENGKSLLKIYIKNYNVGGMFNPFGVSETDMNASTNYSFPPIPETDTPILPETGKTGKKKKKTGNKKKKTGKKKKKTRKKKTTGKKTSIPPPLPRPISPFTRELITNRILPAPTYPYIVKDTTGVPYTGRVVDIDLSKNPILPPPPPEKTLESVIKKNAYDRRLWEIRYRVLENRLNNDPTYELNREQLDFLNWYLGPFDSYQTNRERLIEIDRKYRGMTDPLPPSETIQQDVVEEARVPPDDLMFSMEMGGGSRNYAPNSYALFYEIKESDFDNLDVGDKIFLLELDL